MGSLLPDCCTSCQHRQKNKGRPRKTRHQQLAFFEVLRAGILVLQTGNGGSNNKEFTIAGVDSSVTAGMPALAAAE